MRGGREHLEVHVGHHVGQLGELQLDAQVGLVRTKAEGRILVGHDGELAQIHIQLLLEHFGDHLLEDGADFFFVQERGFAVDLGKFGLAVSAQVFVAEALGDLVVTVEARTISICLYSWGDWGSAKNWPSCTREGTR